MRRGVLIGVIAAIALAAGAWAQDEGLGTALRNTGFEKPDIAAGGTEGSKAEGWFHFSSSQEEKCGVTDTRKKGGTQSLMFQAQSGTNAFQGVAQKVSTQPGQHWIFTVYVLNDPENPLTDGAFGQVNLEWQSDDGTEINRTFGPTWTAELPPRQWQKYMVEGDAPEGATIVVAVVTFFSQTSEGKGTFYLDDCELATGVPKNVTEPVAP